MSPLLRAVVTKAHLDKGSPGLSGRHDDGKFSVHHVELHIPTWSLSNFV